MPGYLVHTRLALCLLESEWLHKSNSIDWHERSIRSCLIAGAIAPDAGYLPGNFRFFSDLAHYMRTGELCKQMLRQATSDHQVAFAIGWFSHVAGDVFFHPLINKETARLLNYPADRTVSYCEAPSIHIRIELGWDLEFGEVNSSVFLQPLLHAEHLSSMSSFVSKSFYAVYGLDISSKIHNTLSYQHRCLNLLKVWYSTLGMKGHENSWGFRFARIIAFALWAILRSMPKGSQAYAVSAPLRDRLIPSRDFAVTLQALLQFAEGHLRENFSKLPDFNLDTGVCDDKLSYPLTRATNERLKLLRNRQ